MRVVTAPWLFLGRSSVAERSAEAIPDGAIAFDGDTIVAAGPRERIESAHGPGAPMDAVLLPALVNAHTHLELSHLRGRVSGGEGLARWVHLLISARAGDPLPGRALDDAMIDLAEAGVAAVGDVSNTLCTLPVLTRAGLAGTVFLEVLGLPEKRIRQAIADAHQLIAKAGPHGPGLSVALAPHAVYSTNLHVVGELLRAGRSSIHLAEDVAERAFCATAGGSVAKLVRAFGTKLPAALGRSAVAVAAPYLNPQSLAVHAVDLDEEDVELLARSGATVVLCPRSNLHIGGRLADLPRLLDAGIPLAVGTDSVASTPSLSPMAELATLSSAFPRIPPSRLLQLAWNGPAVGAPSIGVMGSGTAPGVLAAPLRGERPTDPAAWLIGTFGAEERPFTWVARHLPEVNAA